MRGLVPLYRKLRRRGISLPEGAILDVIRKGPQSMSHIARRMKVSTPSIFQMVDRMEPKGLLTKVTEPKIAIVITEKGLAAISDKSKHEHSTS